MIKTKTIEEKNEEMLFKEYENFEKGLNRRCKILGSTINFSGNKMVIFYEERRRCIRGKHRN